MTDAELLDAIRKICRASARALGVKGADRSSIEAVDLARYDRIVGLLRRHPRPKDPATAGGDDPC